MAIHKTIDARYLLPAHAMSRAQQGELDRLLPDGRKLSLMPSIGFKLGKPAGRIGISEPPPLHNAGFLADSWDFLDFWQAFGQFALWNGEGEPANWSRHANTGRYRIDGIEELEYIKDESGRSLEYCIEYAVRIHAKYLTLPPLTIEKIEACDQCNHALPASFPSGVSVWHVSAKEEFCNFDVYHYRDRSVVIDPVCLITVGLDIILKRLTGENMKD